MLCAVILSGRTHRKSSKRNQSRSGKRGEYMSVPLLRKLYAKTSDTKGAFPMKSFLTPLHIVLNNVQDLYYPMEKH